MRKLRTAVAGLGRIGWQYHLPAITGHEGFELVAVTDPIPARTEEAARQYGVSGYASLQEMLHKENLDLAVIASPTPFHAEQAAACFEHGVDVFMEKPMARSLVEADFMIESMHRHNRKMMVNQPERLSAETRAAQSLIRSGLIGEVYMIKRARSAYVRRKDWQSLKEFGGGMLNNYGAHCIDQLLYLTGARAGRISCSLRRMASLGDADDVVKALIETGNGILLDLDINMAAAFPIPSWQILGSRGTIVLEEQAGGKRVFRIRDLPGDQSADSAVHVELAAEGRLYDHHQELDWQEQEFDLSSLPAIDFYDKCYEYFELGHASLVPVEETREVTRVIEECRKQAGW